MKRRLLFAIGSLISLGSYAQLSGIRQLETSMKKVSGNVYACERETSNKDYLLFLNSLRISGKETAYLKNLPDSQQWWFVNAMPLMSLYHRDTSFASYPVVNLSQDAARAYCAWLSEQYNVTAGRKYKRVVFRLPLNDEEWLKAARGSLPEGSPYPWGNQPLKAADGQYRCNFNRLNMRPPDSVISSLNHGWCKIITKIGAGPLLICPAKAFEPNTIGLYNIAGNVSEMLELPGRTKGGNWNSEKKFLVMTALDEHETFVKPSPYIGFRVYMEIVE